MRPDTARWQAAVEAHVREMGFDAMVESALADPDDRAEELRCRWGWARGTR